MLRSGSTAVITTSAGRLGAVESPPQAERTVASRRDADPMALRVMRDNSATVAEFVQTHVWHSNLRAACLIQLQGVNPLDPTSPRFPMRTLRWLLVTLLFV